MKSFDLPPGPTAFSAWFFDRVITAARDSFVSLKNAVLNDHVGTFPISAAAPSRVKHGLGQIPFSWEILDKNVAADVWKISADATFITLATSADVTVKVRFT